MPAYIDELEVKPELTMEEAAILSYARMISEGEYNQRMLDDLKRWLQELNPNKLTGPSVSQWAQSIIEELRGRETAPELA